MPFRASEARLPSEGMGALTPRPRNERKLSVKMALGICRAVEMMMTEMQLGIRCFLMIQPAPAPVAWAARTYSCSRRERIWPRMRRAMEHQYSRAKMTNSEMMLEPMLARTVPSMTGPRVSRITLASRMTMSMSGRE